MTRRILQQRGRPVTEENSRWRTLGAIWMQERTKTLTDAERETLAKALALLLERPDLAA